MSSSTRLQSGGFFRYLSPHTNRLLAGLQWYSRYCASWTVFLFGLVVIPLLYYADVIGIDRISLLGQYLAFAIVAVSLDLLWGYTGMLSLCHAFFFCLGGYAMGMYLAHHGGPEGIIDAKGWKVPACLFPVYPYKVGETPQDALTPWF